MAERIAGKRGLKPTTRHDTPMIRDHVTVAMEPSYPVDVSNALEDWEMLGNGPDPTVTSQGPDFEGVGDCTFAAREHNKRAKAMAGGETETWETADALVTEYLVYDNGQDDGADIPTLLLAWYKAGKIKAFGKLDPTNKAEVDWATQTFHGAYIGVALTDDADDLFNQNQPWNVDQGQKPDPEEGHCIVKVRAISPTEHDGYVTWGGVQAATVGWSAACVTDTYVIVTTEDEAAKLNMPSLLAAIDAMPDEQGGVPGAPPAPPVPEPGPTPPAPAPGPMPVPPHPVPPGPVPPPSAPNCQFCAWLKRVFR